MLSQQVEEYLEAVGKLEERGEAVTTSSLARERGVSLPSATEMLQRLADQGLVTYEQRKRATLTPAGRCVASTVVRRHRLWERFLHDILGLQWDQVHDEACKLEHATSPDVESRLAEVLGGVDTCPHGHAIPEPDTDLAREEIRSLALLEVGQFARVVSVRREDADTLRRLAAAGIRPGAVLQIADRADDTLSIAIAGGRQSLDWPLAQLVIATPIESEAAGVHAGTAVALPDLANADRAIVHDVRGGQSFVGRCLALGFTPGAPIRMIQNFGSGPLIVLVRDTRVALGRGEAQRIHVIRQGTAA
jgi:DtxR family Mn-dependent transcriptional regulator